MTKLGFNIKNILKANRKAGVGIKHQHELAEKAGCSVWHLSAIVSGKSKPSMGMLEAIAQALDTTISDLLKD